MGLLEEARADLSGRYVGGEGEMGSAAALGVLQALDQVGVAGSAGAGEDGETPSAFGLGRGGQRTCLLVADVNPLDAGG